MNNQQTNESGFLDDFNTALHTQNIELLDRAVDNLRRQGYHYTELLNLAKDQGVEAGEFDELLYYADSLNGENPLPF